MTDNSTTLMKEQRLAAYAEGERLGREKLQRKEAALTKLSDDVKGLRDWDLDPIGDLKESLVSYPIRILLQELEIAQRESTIAEHQNIAAHRERLGLHLDRAEDHQKRMEQIFADGFEKIAQALRQTRPVDLYGPRGTEIMLEPEKP